MTESTIALLPRSLQPMGLRLAILGRALVGRGTAVPIDAATISSARYRSGEASEPTLNVRVAPCAPAARMQRHVRAGEQIPDQAFRMEEQPAAEPDVAEQPLPERH